MWRGALFLLVLLMPFAVVCQQAAPDSAAKAPGYDPPVSGPKLFQAYCAGCHGSDGKGNGPMAASLKTWPADLTVIARRNRGSFPTLHVSEAIDGERTIPAHGSRDMPMWGPVFRSIAHGHADSAQLRINNLVAYIESIQEK